MTVCEKCGKPARQVVPVMSNDARFRVLDDIMDMNRHLPRAALTVEQNAAIPWGTHPDDHQFQAWCLDCAAPPSGHPWKGHAVTEALAIVLAVAIIAWWVAIPVLCWLKGKRWFALFSVLGLALWPCALASVIGAIRLGKPESWWARKYYDDAKMRRTRERFYQ